ncbi:MAG TPA: response regulator [Steroidobacteraceae bacterium]|jgi:PAS domain S-box-containing protein|nr:response regulator [Steroidobacteraceae bacterium]
MACVRILIADDHELLRETLRTLLASQPAWEVCGEAADGVEAIEKAAQLRPDIVLLDVSMPRLSGLEAAAAIRRESPGSEIVIVSQHDPAEMLPSALKAGARGFVSKSDIGSNLLSTIESILDPTHRAGDGHGGKPASAAAGASGGGRASLARAGAAQRAARLGSLHPERGRAESLLLEQNYLFELIARGRPLDDCLRAITESVTLLQPGASAAVILASCGRARRERIVSSRLSPQLMTELGKLPFAGDDMPMPRDAVVLHGKPISVADIGHDARWAPAWRELCTAHGVHALHATPVHSADGAVTAAFLVCLGEARQPNAWERDLGQFGAHLASLAIERWRAEAALRESEQKFRTLFESIDEGFCVLERVPAATGAAADFRFLQVNPGFIAHTAASEVAGRTLREAFPAEPDDWFRAYEHILESGESRRFEHGQLDRGRVLELYAFRVEDGSQARLAVIVKDITERKRVEEVLRQRSAQFEILVDRAPIGVFLLDGKLRVRQVNPAARPAFGPTPELVGRDYGEVLSEIRAPEYAAEVLRIFRHTLATGESHHAVEQAISRRDRPQNEHYDWRVDRIPLPEGGYGVVCYFREVSAEMHARAALREARDHLESRVRERTEELEKAYRSLRVLSMRMMQMQDEDRRRIARDLHDSAGQLLAALGMELASLNRRAATLSPELAEDIGGSLQLVQQLTQDIRTASYLLHPPLLDDAGLTGALRWYVTGLSKRSGIAIRLELDERLGRLPRELEAAVFHIVQESLTNIHRHSGSKTAILRIELGGGRLLLEIEDEGSGIPAEKLREIQMQGSGVGIAGMRERVLHFNGDMRITSLSTGTRIAVSFPVEPGGLRSGPLMLNS